MTAQTRDEFLSKWAGSLSDGGTFKDTMAQLDDMLDAWDDNTALREKEKQIQAVEDVAIALYSSYRLNFINSLPWVNLSGVEKDRWRKRARKAQSWAEELAEEES